MCRYIEGGLLAGFTTTHIAGVRLGTTREGVFFRNRISS